MPALTLMPDSLQKLSRTMKTLDKVGSAVRFGGVRVGSGDICFRRVEPVSSRRCICFKTRLLAMWCGEKVK